MGEHEDKIGVEEEREEELDTYPKLLLRNYRRYANKVSVRLKKYGI